MRGSTVGEEKQETGNAKRCRAYEPAEQILQADRRVTAAGWTGARVERLPSFSRFLTLYHVHATLAGGCVPLS